MTSYQRGDVILVGFVFSDESGAKLRPAVIVSSAPYHRRGQELVVAAVTSNVKRRLFGDQVIAGWQQAGLLFPSLATGILRTIKRSMVARRLGALTRADLSVIDQGLKRSLGL